MLNVFVKYASFISKKFSVPPQGFKQKQILLLRTNYRSEITLRNNYRSEITSRKARRSSSPRQCGRKTKKIHANVAHDQNHLSSSSSAKSRASVLLLSCSRCNLLRTAVSKSSSQGGADELARNKFCQKKKKNSKHMRSDQFVNKYPSDHKIVAEQTVTKRNRDYKCF